MSTNTFKDAALEAATKVTSKDVAARAWAILTANYCGGAEPTAEGVKDASAEELKGIAIPPAIAKVWAPLFAAPPDEDEETGFDPNKRRGYSETALVRMYVRNPDDPLLNKEIDRRSEDEAWVIHTAGEVHQAQSAQFLGYLAAGKVPPAFADVDGRQVAPVVRGAEKQAKVRTYVEDPSAVGQKLPVDEISAVTRADFTGVSHEARQVYREALRHELHRVSVMEMRRVARELAGKDLTGELPALAQKPGYLAVKALLPDALRTWMNRKPAERDTLVITEAQTSSGFSPAGEDEGHLAGRPGVVLEEDQDPRLAFVAQMNGRPPREATRLTVSPATLPKFDQARIFELHSAVMTVGIERGSLMAGIPVEFVSGMPDAGSPGGQILSDIHALNGVVLSDGSAPIRTWLNNAVYAARMYKDGAVFKAALAQLDARRSPLAHQQGPAGPPLIFVVGAGHEAATATLLRTHANMPVRAGEFRLVMDTDCPPGSMPREHFAANLAAASIVVILCSSTTMGSEEFDRVEAFASNSSARFVPVLVSACFLEGTFLGGKAALPPKTAAGDTYLSRVSDKNDAMLTVVAALRKIAAGIADKQRR